MLLREMIKCCSLNQSLKAGFRRPFHGSCHLVTNEISNTAAHFIAHEGSNTAAHTLAHEGPYRTTYALAHEGSDTTAYLASSIKDLR